MPSEWNSDIPGRQTKRRPEKGGKLNTSQAGSVAASRAAVGQFLSLFRVAFRLATRYKVFHDRWLQQPLIPGPQDKCLTGNGEKLTYNCPAGCN